jgi:hypothetical protein
MEKTIFHNLKDSHSKSLEPDSLSPFSRDYDTVSLAGEGWGEGEQD